MRRYEPDSASQVNLDNVKRYLSFIQSIAAHCFLDHEEVPPSMLINIAVSADIASMVFCKYGI